MALVGKSFGGKSSLLFIDFLDEIADLLPAWRSRSLFLCEAPPCSSLLQTYARPRPWMIMNACLSCLWCAAFGIQFPDIYKYLPEDRRLQVRLTNFFVSRVFADTKVAIQSVKCDIKVEPMYQYSLEWFIDIFLLAIKTAEKPERNLQRRLTVFRPCRWDWK